MAFTQPGQPNQTFGLGYDQTGTGFANGVGRLTSTTHPNGSTSYSYDQQGRVLTDTQTVNAAAGANSAAISNKVTYGYDLGGNITSMAYPSGRVVTVSYTAGQPTAISLAQNANGSPTPLLASITFSPFGGPLSWQQMTTAGAVTKSRVYDTAGRLVRYQLGGFVRDITYDAADRITNYTHYDVTTGTATTASSALDQGFGYDNLGRITSVSAGSASWSITYDANGNRTGVTLNGTPSAYTVSATSNQLQATSSPARSFGYDAAGNTTSDSGGSSAGYTSTYDASGRLATLTRAGATTTFSYDGMGRRVRKFSDSGSSSTVLFAYDQAGQLIGEYDSNGTPLREYVYLGNTPVAMFTPDPANSANPPLIYFIDTDHLNTPRVVTDASNQLRWRWMAEPFGTTAPETNPQGIGAFTQNLRFPGQYADQETGLSYNAARDYDSTTGRYVQSDPIGLNGGGSIPMRMWMAIPCLL